jgi:hypothetical protein
VNTVIDSVADMVRGNVSAVIDKVDDALGKMVPILIGFLANLVNLGGIGQKIREIVEKLQKPVNKALDFVINTGLKLAGPIIRGISGISRRVKAKVAAGKAWVKGKVESGKEWVAGKAVGVRDRLTGQRPRAEGARPGLDDAPQRLHGATSAAQSLMQQPGATTDSVRSGLPAIRDRFRLTSIDLANVGGHDWHVVAHINPELPSDSRKLPSPEELRTVRDQVADIATLWRANRTAERFKNAGRAEQRRILLDPEAYQRPGGREDLPAVSVGDLAESRQRRVARCSCGRRCSWRTGTISHSAAESTNSTFSSSDRPRYAW